MIITTLFIGFAVGYAVASWVDEVHIKKIGAKIDELVANYDLVPKCRKDHES